ALVPVVVLVVAPGHAARRPLLVAGPRADLAAADLGREGFAAAGALDALADEVVRNAQLAVALGTGDHVGHGVTCESEARWLSILPSGPSVAGRGVVVLTVSFVRRSSRF